MSMYVIVLAESSTEVVGRWDVFQSGEAPNTNHWAPLTLRLIRRARETQEGGAEVYFGYSKKSFWSFDEAMLKKMAQAAQGSTWDAAVFAIVDRQTWADAYQQESWEAACREWFGTAVEAGVEALLEVDLNAVLSGGEYGALRVARAAVKSRERSLGGFDLGRPWRIAFARGRNSPAASPTRLLEDLMEPFIAEGGKADRESNLCVIVKASDARVQLGAVVETLADRSPERSLVATLGVKAKNPLKDHCSSKEIRLLHFSGPFELGYFVWKHNSSLSRGWLRISPTNLHLWELYSATLARFRTHHKDSDIEAVVPSLIDNLEALRNYGPNEVNTSQRSEIIHRLNRLSPEGTATFTALLAESVSGIEPSCLPGASQAPPSPAVLVTHTFDPDLHIDYCLLAARLFGGIRPITVSRRIHLAGGCDPIRDMMDMMGSVAVWVFLGPSEGPDGLWDAAQQALVRPEGWAACLCSAPQVPSLVLLLAGRSTETARHLAESGIGIACAIGLEGETLTEDVARPMKKVLRQVLDYGVNETTIREILAEETRFSMVTGGAGSRLQAFFAGS